MSSVKETKIRLSNGGLDERIADVYGCEQSDAIKIAARYVYAAEEFEVIFGNKEVSLFSAPGRTEIGGNHTDHQHGHVLAASVDLDVIAVAARNGSRVIRIKSEGHPLDLIDIDDLHIHENEYNHSASLIRGIASAFKEKGYSIDGFDAYTVSSVLKGSGLSSSAAFEVLVGNIINTFFAAGKEDEVAIAQIGQYAENVYYGKPCGLMDQMASSVGGIIAIDFKNTACPKVEKVEYDFHHSGYLLCIIDSGADHGDLTDEYASIPREMKNVAGVFEKEFLRDVSEDVFYQNLAGARKIAGDRAVLRAIHYFSDDKRVLQQVDALKKDDFDRFLHLIIESGRSSCMYLQNVFASSNPQEQSVSLVLAECERLLANKGGAWRVHGGGFAGTVQAFIPISMAEEMEAAMEALIGPGKCHMLNIRPIGGTCIC